jgi:mRNA interferase RelE/StbE
VYRIVIENCVQKILNSLPVSEANKIKKEIELLAENPRKHGVIKLKDSEPAQYRTRKGNYRIIFQIEDDILLILVIRIFIRGDDY